MNLRRRLRGLACLPGALLASQHQQFGVDGEQFGGDIFELSPGLNAWTNSVEPIDGNSFDSLFAGGHKGKGGEGMTIAVGAVTRRLSAAAKGNDERAWKSIVGQMEASQQKAGASAEAGSFRAVGWMDTHNLIVIIQSDNLKNNTLGECFFRYRSA